MLRPAGVLGISPGGVAEVRWVRANFEVAYQCATFAQFEKSVDQRIGRTLRFGPSLCLYPREVGKSSFSESGLSGLTLFRKLKGFFVCPTRFLSRR